MGFKEAVRTCLREKYFTFSGRASRSEYWYYMLFVTLVWIALIAVIALVGGQDLFVYGDFGAVNGLLIAIVMIVGIGLYIPTISAMVRRYHDRNLSGWWVLGVMIGTNIPYVGVVIGIVSLVITILKGTEGENRFGPDPLQEQNSAEVFA